jgi:serine/threonine protein kinase
MTIRDFLTRIDLPEYADAFERQHVTVADLGDLSDDDLSNTFGMVRFVDRKRLKAAVGSAGTDPAILGPRRPTAPPPGFASSPSSSNALSSLGSYDLYDCIGEGGMGSVYRGRHRAVGIAQRQGGDVAVKVVHAHLLSKGDISERFRREAEALTLLDHPNIVKVHDVVEESGRTAIVMEWVPGRALSAVIGKETGPIPWDRAQAMVVPMLSAVSHAHSRGIVHRDLKPENIVVMPSGEIKLLDFGIARLGESRGRTKTGTGMGTVDYMAPEQFLDAKGVDLRADVYALGLTLYEMLAGRLPWDAADSEFEVMSRKKDGRIPPPTEFYPSIPPWVVSGVMAAIRPSPLERTQSVALLEASLRGEGANVSLKFGGYGAKPSTGSTALHVATEQHAVTGEFVLSTGFLGMGRQTENRTIGLSMVAIPPHTFMMGSPFSEPGRAPDEVQHEVRFTNGYAMSTTAVTQELWIAVMGTNPSYFASGAQSSRRPVEKVSWYDAVRFCNALSAKLGLVPVYRIGAGNPPTVDCLSSSSGFRLPTEPEWECAARAGTLHRYAGGDDIGAVGWCKDNGNNSSHVVGQRLPNAYGLHDMSGNVWEWTQDLYRAYPSDVVLGELVAGVDVVVRGGSWNDGAGCARVADRGRVKPSDSFSSVGFRLCRTLP